MSKPVHDPATASGKPPAFWLLIWAVVFLVIFNLVLFAKFVIGSSSDPAPPPTNNPAASTPR